jgi:hypothetical protein
MPFLEDSFTDTSGLVLDSHTGEIGATWTKHPSFASGEYAIDGSGRLRCKTAPSAYYASGVPASADYSVEAPIAVLTAARRFGMAGRMSTSADTMYHIQWVTAEEKVTLFKRVAGTNTSLGTATLKPEVGVNHTLRLEMTGSAIKVFIDAAEKISAVDGTITAAGRAGVHTTENSSTNAGMVLISITATNAAEAVALPSLAAISQSSAALGAAATTQVPVAAAAGQSAAVLSVKATTQPSLGSSTGQAGAVLSLAAPSKLALGAGTAQSSAALSKLTFATSVGLQASNAASGTAGAPLLLNEDLLLGPDLLLGSPNTFLRLHAPTQVQLQPATAATNAGLGPLGVEVRLPITSASASSSASLGTVTTAAQLDFSAEGQTTATFSALSAATAPALQPAVGTTTATLALNAAAYLDLQPSRAAADAELGLTGTGAVIFQPGEGQGDASLGLEARTHLPLLGAVGQSEAILLASVPAPLELYPSEGHGEATLGSAAVTELGVLHAAAISTAAISSGLFRGMELIDQGRDGIVDGGVRPVAHRGRQGDAPWPI